MDLTNETVDTREISYGWVSVPVGTPTRLRPLGPSKHAKGVVISAPGSSDPPANTATVYIGGPNVTADRSETGGIPVPPGEACNFKVNDASELFAVTNAENQVVCWGCL